MCDQRAAGLKIIRFGVAGHLIFIVCFVGFGGEADVVL